VRSSRMSACFHTKTSACPRLHDAARACSALAAQIQFRFLSHRRYRRSGRSTAVGRHDLSQAGVVVAGQRDGSAVTVLDASRSRGTRPNLKFPVGRHTIPQRQKEGPARLLRVPSAPISSVTPTSGCPSSVNTRPAIDVMPRGACSRAPIRRGIRRLIFEPLNQLLEPAASDLSLQLVESIRICAAFRLFKFPAPSERIREIGIRFHQVLHEREVWVKIFAE
jgi:hypothetical protein